MLSGLLGHIYSGTPCVQQMRGLSMFSQQPGVHRPQLCCAKQFGEDQDTCRVAGQASHTDENAWSFEPSSRRSWSMLCCLARCRQLVVRDPKESSSNVLKRTTSVPACLPMITPAQHINFGHSHFPQIIPQIAKNGVPKMNFPELPGPGFSVEILHKS